MYKVKYPYNTQNNFNGWGWSWVIHHVYDTLLLEKYDNKNWNYNSLYIIESNNGIKKWNLIHHSFKNNMITLLEDNSNKEDIDWWWSLEDNYYIFSRSDVKIHNIIWGDGKDVPINYENNKWYLLSFNPNIVECDYHSMKNHFFSTYGKELIEWQFHPKNQMKWQSWGFE
jgi:hypothetical protein